MKQGQCPSCGAPVEFRPGAGRVKVCEHCHTVVLLGDANLESLGRVADLVDTDSPVHVGLSGRYQQHGFTVVGRIQKSHGTGTWDEWCLELDDGRQAWLSESEGQWNFMFEGGDVEVPAFDSLRPAQPLSIREKRFVVEELGHADTVSAEGQLPSFEAQHQYADCTGPGGVFASVDYSTDTPTLFIGEQVSLRALGFDSNDLKPTWKREALRQARCTNCNGPLDLRAPDRTKRVVCPYCAAMIDVSNGELQFLQMLEKPPYQPLLPLGGEGTLTVDGKPVTFTTIAFLIRSCTVEGNRYSWDEYLLFHHDHGFRWLMQANGHWTLLTPIAAGEVLITGRSARYKNESYRQFQSVVATTEYVLGECYWEVSAGEVAHASEFVNPPKSLNLDLTQNEATFTFGELLERKAVQAAFKPEAPLPPQQGLAPATKSPWADRVAPSWKWALIWSAALIAVTLVFAVGAPSGTLLDTTVSVPRDAKPGSPEAMFFSQAFTVKEKTPLSVNISANSLDNNWVGVTVDLVNEATDEVISVYAEPSYYSGRDSDGSWSEGSRGSYKDTDEVDPGSYVLRSTATFEPGRGVPDYRVTVQADGGPGFLCPFLLLFVLFAWPIAVTVFSSQWDSKKWEDSVFQATPF